VGFQIVDVLQQTSGPDFKDAFHSDETIGIFLVLDNLAAVCPLKGDPTFRKHSKKGLDHHRGIVELSLGVLVQTEKRVECRSAHVDIIQQVACFDVVVDYRSAWREGMRDEYFWDSEGR